MPVVIPQDVAYEERFIGPLNVKQSVYAGVAGAIILFLWMFSGIESMIIKVVITFVVFVIAAGVISFNLDVYATNVIASIPRSVYTGIGFVVILFLWLLAGIESMATKFAITLAVLVAIDWNNRRT